MSPEAGGIFDLLLRLVRVGLGGKAGSGRQFVSWIHYLDFINAIEFLIDRIEFNGCVNVTAPVPLSNEEFMYGLRQAWYNSTVALPLPALPSPEWLLAAGAFLLRTEPELLLKSRRVIPTLLTIAGFQFDYPTWPAAAEDLIARRQKS